MKSLILSLFFLSSFAVQAEIESPDDSIRILTPDTLKSIMGPYPEKGSHEELQDFAAMMKFQLTRTKADCDSAAGFESISLENLFAGQNGPLTKSEARRVTPRLALVMGEGGINSLHAKRIYKRPRPYIRNPLIIPCIKKESSYAYPSGHTTHARLLARALSEIFPERAESLMKRADDIALSRIIGGVHHPSDIIAGKKLADALAEERLSSPEFQEMLIDLQ